MSFIAIALARQRYAVLQGEFVREFILSMIAVVRVFCRSRSDTALEVLALRQQVAVPKAKTATAKLNRLDRDSSGPLFAIVGPAGLKFWSS